MRGKQIKRYTAFVSLVLLVALTNLTISPSYSALECQAAGAYNLHPGFTAGPIVNNGRSDRNKLESSVLEQLLYDPEVLDRLGRPDEDVLLFRQGSEVRIHYSKAINLTLKDEKILKSELVPCSLDGEMFFIHILECDDGSKKTNVVEVSELGGYMGEISDAVNEEAQKVVAQLKEPYNSEAFSGSFAVAPTDDAVVLSGLFLKKIGAMNVSKDLELKAREGKVRIVPFGKMSEGSIVVAVADDPKERAWSITAGMILCRGYNPDDFEEAFNAYYGRYVSRQEAAFNLQDIDNDSSIKRLVKKMDQEPIARNDGTMEFADQGYSRMWKDVALTRIEDCDETLKDIKRIFREVAIHDADEHNKDIRSGRKTGAIIDPEQMPGYDGRKISIVKLSNTLPPTDITTDDGVIRINENFVKLMHFMREQWMQEPFSDIPEYRSYKLFPGKVIGEMYESIMYSLAIHTIRGHFPIDKEGTPTYDSDEFTAQAIRGRGHLYVNTLAMMYYWIMLVERHQYPLPRAKMFMRTYPHIFKGLTAREKYDLPLHLMHFVDYLSTRESLPHTGMELIFTGESKYSVDRVVRRYANASSNEGFSGKDEEAAGNEGDIHFRKGAFELVYADIKGIEDKEVVETERFIRAVFRNVAMHELLDHNSKVEEKYEVREEDMPGLDPVKIKFEEISKGHIIPTDITTKDGVVRINKNFAKMMHIFLTNPEDTEVGREFAEVGKSIIYSLAIHTIRGHFEIVPQGFVRFVKDEKRAQPERGHKYLYHNILGTVYYWLMVIERDTSPHWRLESFMEENPEVFADLTPEERKRLPKDLKELVEKFDRAGLFRHYDLSYSSHMTVRDYSNILKSYPGSVSNEGDPFKYVMLEEIAKSKVLFLTIFKSVMFAGREYTAESLSEMIEGISPAIASIYLDAFVEAGILVHQKEADGKRYEMFKFTPKETGAISDIFMGMDSFGPEDVAGAKGKLLKITEARQAELLMEELAETAVSKEVRESGEKIIVAVETDWVSGAQKNYVQELIKATEGLKKNSPIVIVRGAAGNLASELEKTVRKEGVSLKNVVVLASGDTLKDKYFDSIRAIDDNDLDKAFLAEIDASNLNGDSYVRILEMMTMAVRLAFGQRTLGDHPDIEVNFRNNRTVVFIPRAEPLDYEDLKEIYRSQRRILRAA